MKTIVKGIIFEDFINYKKPSMVIEMPYCDFKCDKEYGSQICQNSSLASQPNIEIDIDEIIDSYVDNIITEAIVFQGLEPFFAPLNLMLWVNKIRSKTNDDIIIYTGYNKEEIKEHVLSLYKYPNIIIKFGRFIPNQKPHYDPVLGVNLASENQYAEVIS